MSNTISKISKIENDGVVEGIMERLPSELLLLILMWLPLEHLVELAVEFKYIYRVCQDHETVLCKCMHVDNTEADYTRKLVTRKIEKRKRAAMGIFFEDPRPALIVDHFNISFKGKEIKVLPKRLFNGSYNQTYGLDLSENRIRIIPPLTFTNDSLCFLQVLDLSHNQLRYISISVCKALCTLRLLDLSWNQLKTLPQNMRHLMPYLEEINVSNNPLLTVTAIKNAKCPTTDAHIFTRYLQRRIESPNEPIQFAIKLARDKREREEKKKRDENIAWEKAWKKRIDAEKDPMACLALMRQQKKEHSIRSSIHK